MSEKNIQVELPPTFLKGLMDMGEIMSAACDDPGQMTCPLLVLVRELLENAPKEFPE